MRKIYYGTRSLDRFESGSVITIGAFDGVHLGHQAVIARLIECAEKLSLPAVVVTFFPDPAQYFRPDTAPPQILSWRENALALLDAGADAVVCLPFNEAVRTMSAQDFVHQVLVAGLCARYVVVGDDFRFGLEREGDFKLLEKLGEDAQFSVEKTQTTIRHDDRVSSTRIRSLLEQGRITDASELLGRPYETCGRVVRGHQLGRTLGYPTANVDLKRAKVALSGVYAVRIKIANHWHDGVANIGYRPAVNSVQRPLLEVHVFNFAEDIYGQRVRVRYCKKLRDETAFDDLHALKKAIEKDAYDAQDWFEKHPEELCSGV